jgi:isopenicillin-N epimerase
MYLRDFDYQGTLDYSHILTLPKSIEAMGQLLPGGWPQLMRENHEKIMQAREIIAPVLEPLGCTVHTAPEHMTGTMTSVIVPDPAGGIEGCPTRYDDPLQDALYERHGVVTPVWRFNPTNARVVRLSAQVYNTPEQYEYFAKAVAEELRRQG